MPSGGVEQYAISGLLLRRAVLGILLGAHEPLTAREVAAALRVNGVTTNPMLLKGTSRVIADLLAYQARVGRVRKVGPATFVVISGSMSRSTRWRCLHWRDEVARRRALEDEFASNHASLADLSALVDLESRLFEEDADTHDTFIDLTWSEREGAADFTRLLDSQDCLVLVARTTDEVVGHLVGHTTRSSPTRLPVTYANLRSLYVLSAHRRQGVADLLVSEFLNWARNCGCVEVHVDSYALNESAQRFYERRGFVVRSVSRALDLTTP